jgi:hypothetical protein
MSKLRWSLFVAANVVVWCVLSFYQASSAAPGAGQLPFANSVDQRQQVIRELQEIKALLKEQNALLRLQNSKNQNNEPTLQ